MSKQIGFLLSYIRYGDHDAIVHGFTQECGFQSFFLRGIYSSKNKKKPYLAPLNELIFTLKSDSFSSALPQIQKIEMHGEQMNQLLVKQNVVIFFMAEFLHQTLKNEEANQLLYQEIAGLRKSILQGDSSAHFVFMIRLLRIFGIAPLVTDKKYLNIEQGGFEDFFSKDQAEEYHSSLWKKILAPEEDLALRIEKSQRKKLLNSILAYYQYHFPDFQVPKSLAVIQQLMD